MRKKDSMLTNNGLCSCNKRKIAATIKGRGEKTKWEGGKMKRNKQWFVFLH